MTLQLKPVNTHRVVSNYSDRVWTILPELGQIEP